MKRIELVNRIKSKGSFLCIGLDPDPKLMPSVLGTDPDAVFTFNKAIIDATAQYCIAYKPNTAFYECLGLKGGRLCLPQSDISKTTIQTIL